jgi:hypothetical protein
MITRTVVLLALLVLAPLSFLAQVTKGSISGTVVDASGAVISEASLKATNTETGVIYQAVTEKSGLFRFSLIPPGSYRLEIAKTGFETKVITHLNVGTSQDSGLGAVVLGVAGARTDVQVSETEAPLIETTQAQITNTFSPKNMELLTGVNENQGLDNLALLVPGVNLSRDNNFSNSNGATFTSNGIRGRSTDQQIDGQNNNDNSVAGPAIQISDAEFVSEYQIITNNFGPEYGRNGGSVVNVVTKSGTNYIHGSMYGNWTNNQLETLTNVEKTYEGLTALPRSNTEFAGFTIGFPILKNKAFFFNGFDEQIYHETAVRHSDSITPTPTGLTQLSSCSGVNANTLAALKTYGPYGMTTGDPFATNATTINLTINGASCPVQMGGITRSVPARSHLFNWIPRFDYQTGKDTLTARYALNRNNYFGASDNAAAGYLYNEPALGQAIKLGWTRTITQNLVNELSISYARNNVMFDGNTTPSIGQANQAVSHITVGTTAGYSALGYGSGTTMPQGRVINTYQIQDNLNYQLGRHHLKAGINYTHQLSMNPFLPNQNGSFSFSSWATYLVSHPSSVSIADGINILHFKENDVFAYVGDDWQFNKNLTFNLGLTYSFYGQPANLFHENDVKLQTGSSPLWDPTLPLSVTTFQELPNDYKLFAPSAGFAWSPEFLSGAHKTVVRGGYRLAYDPPFYNIYLNISSSAPQVFSQTFTSSSVTYGLLPATPKGPNVRSALSSYLTKGVYDPRSYSQTKVSNNFTADKVQSWTVGIQRELATGLAAEVRYVGNHGSDLFQSINANPYLAGLKAAFPGMVPSSITLGSNGRVDGTSSLIRSRINGAKSDYHAVQSQIRADNLFRQLFLSASYTFSKTTDTASEIYGTGGGGNTVAFSQNPLNYGSAEHALSGIDYPHNFTVNFAEQIPFMKSQHGIVGHALGGWSVSGTYYIASGQNYTPIQYYYDYYGSRSGVVDYSFNAAFAGVYDGLRPFSGNRKAPVTAVGAYAGDVCNFYGGYSCNASPTQLISWNASNAGGDATASTVKTVTKDDVRYIMNSYYAQQANSTPFGNVGRNDARDYWTNTGDLSVAKSIKLRENMKAMLRANISNIFNHPNFSSVDPYLDDAGLTGEDTGFGDPSSFSGGRRTVTFSGKISW